MNDSQALAAILDQEALPSILELGRESWGFGGVHGGLLAAALTSSVRARGDGRSLRQISARFVRAIRDPFQLQATPEHAGRATESWSATACVGERLHAAAHLVLDTGERSGGLPRVAPTMPRVPGAQACEPITIDPELVPFARRTEIRPVGRARPFSAGQEPVLMAWLRFAADDTPVNVARLLVLMDSLAPSYSALLSTPTPIPTIQFSVRPSLALERTTSPWLLLRARTLAAEGDGWMEERIDAWAPTGEHLGGAEQLRLVVPRGK